MCKWTSPVIKFRLRPRVLISLSTKGHSTRLYAVIVNLVKLKTCAQTFTGFCNLVELLFVCLEGAPRPDCYTCRIVV